mmetsp:Transcript_17087/g.42030  ORF Transcript_17087/g.42030 Transcript_17087/m.42030 type:complete len:253 (+) Transcript_17087:256-1014(+)
MFSCFKKPAVGGDDFGGGGGGRAASKAGVVGNGVGNGLPAIEPLPPHGTHHANGNGATNGNGNAKPPEQQQPQQHRRNDSIDSLHGASAAPPSRRTSVDRRMSVDSLHASPAPANGGHGDGGGGGGGGVDAGYAGLFVTNAVVVLPDGRQGVVLRREGGDVEVRIGTVKALPNGENRLDSLAQTAPVEVLSEGELSLAKPQKKDRVLVVSGESRGAAAELIGVDDAEGVLRMDATKDVTIHEMTTLARIYVG